MCYEPEKANSPLEQCNSWCSPSDILDILQWNQRGDVLPSESAGVKLQKETICSNCQTELIDTTGSSEGGTKPQTNPFELCHSHDHVNREPLGHVGCRSIQRRGDGAVEAKSGTWVLPHVCRESEHIEMSPGGGMRRRRRNQPVLQHGLPRSM